MTTTSGVSSTNNSSSSSSSNALGAQSASASYNTFLTLLTTQLQNQDPLNPTNTDTFTSEMIQLSGVEQELNIEDTLSTISTNLNSLTASNGLGYVGKTVTASGDTSPMQNGTAQWSYSSASDAATVKLSVEDSDGNTVYTTTGDASSGTHSFSWNGTTMSGTQLTSGDYKLTVTAEDSDGSAVDTSVNLVGTVTGVDNSSGETTLKVGDVEVPVADVASIS